SHHSTLMLFSVLIFTRRIPHCVLRTWNGSHKVIHFCQFSLNYFFHVACHFMFLWCSSHCIVSPMKDHRTLKDISISFFTLRCHSSSHHLKVIIPSLGPCHYFFTIVFVVHFNTSFQNPISLYQIICYLKKIK